MISRIQQRPNRGLLMLLTIFDAIAVRLQGMQHERIDDFIPLDLRDNDVLFLHFQKGWIAAITRLLDSFKPGEVSLGVPEFKGHPILGYPMWVDPETGYPVILPAHIQEFFDSCHATGDGSIELFELQVRAFLTTASVYASMDIMTVPGISITGALKELPRAYAYVAGWNYAMHEIRYTAINALGHPPQKDNSTHTT